MSGPVVPGRSNRRDLGRHLLGSSAFAARIVAEAGIEPTDLVFDVGAGTGTLTAALAARGAHVVAIEIDAALAAGLTRRFADARNVVVFTCDAIGFPLPSTPYRVVANPPFNRTSALLHHLLDDPAGGLVRADLVVQWQVARARAQVGVDAPLDLVGAAWAPWWSFRRGRRLPAPLFRPAPSVDAAILTVTRREPALLSESHAVRYAEFVREWFAAAPRSLSVDDWILRFNRVRPR